MDRKEYQKHWRQNNRERIKEFQKSYYYRNKERNKLYRSANMENIKKRRKEYHATLNGRFKHWKCNAKNRKVPFELSFEVISNMPLICHYTGMPLTLKPKSYYTVSLDRLDSSKGYTKDNVVFCCGFINYMKRDLTYDQFIMACKKISKHHDSII